MSLLKIFALLASANSIASAYSTQFRFHNDIEVETRSLDQIYQAALQEGGNLTVWHGGDEKTQQKTLKAAFEARFPGITLNLTVDLSKYHDANIDLQLANDNVYVDSIILQTLHDYPRWKEEGALLEYKPVGFQNIHEAFRDRDGAYMGLYIIAWSNIWNTNYVNSTSAPKEYSDFLNPEFKNKLALTYPNDDDAVLYQFNLILNQYGTSWFDSLLAQNPHWVRGTATPTTLVRTSNGTYTATFTSSIGTTPFSPLNISYPTQGSYVSWPQTGAILKKAPHPEAAKLLHNYLLSEEYVNTTNAWSSRSDLPSPAGFPSILEINATDATKLSQFMSDRAAVERLRFFFESRIGTAQGLSPLIDGI